MLRQHPSHPKLKTANAFACAALFFVCLTASMIAAVRIKAGVRPHIALPAIPTIPTIKPNIQPLLHQVQQVQQGFHMPRLPMFSTLQKSQNGPPQLFYRSIGGGMNEGIGSNTDEKVEGVLPPLMQSAQSRKVQTEKNDNSVFTLEIKVTPNRQEAQTLVAHLATRGIDAYYTPVQRGSKVLFRVRRGVYGTFSQAERASTHLRQKAELNAKVVQLY